MIIEYDKMLELTKAFYSKIDLNISDEDITLAVQSLTMPQYAKEYNDIHSNKIEDHRGLATVGDSICGAYVMLKEFKNDISPMELTQKKDVVTNSHLNALGETLLKGYLFYSNNDINPKNTKDYATSFEAIIGFISLIDREAAFNLLEKILK